MTPISWLQVAAKIRTAPIVKNRKKQPAKVTLLNANCTRIDLPCLIHVQHEVRVLATLTTYIAI